MAQRSSARTALLVLLLLGAVAFVGNRILTRLDDPKFLPLDDFVEYYAAGVLNARGQDPYDANLMLDVERAAGRTEIDQAVMMWNPPWTLSLAMPLAKLSPRTGQLLWLLVSFCVVAFCADRIWLEYGGPRDRRALAWGIAFVFPPTLFLLQSGQIGAWLLLGATGFLLLVRRERYLAAGAVAALMAIKPHLIYLFWPALAVWVLLAWRSRRWLVVVGGIAAGVAASIAPVIANPEVFDQYRAAMTERPPDQWKSPTLGTLLREIFGEERFRLQFVPPVLGMLWLVISLWRWRREEWDWAERLPLILLVSFVTAPYGAWPFDLVMLLPAVLQIAARVTASTDRPWRTRSACAFGLLVVGALLTNLLRLHSEFFVWMAPTILVLYLWLRPSPGTSVR